MQYDATTPAQYFSLLQDDWRKEKLMEVRELILASGPELSEGIEYKMLSYGNEHENIFHLNAQKGFVALYVGSIDKVKGGAELLEAYSRGKGCIRIKKANVILESGLPEFITKAVDSWRSGEEFGC